MYKTIIISTFALLLSINIFAQKYAYVDSEYIMNNIPEYKDAQLELDDYAMEYKEKVQEAYDKIEELQAQFRAESVLMPEEVKEKKLQEINDKIQEAKDLQKSYFGPKGELFVLREDLIRPIQEKIYNAIQELAEEKNYSFVFDKAGSISILYVQARYDISDDVLDKVGAVMGTVRKEDRERAGSSSSSEKSNSSSKASSKPSSKPGKGMMPPSFGGKRK
jgi:outer membrane protein